MVEVRMWERTPTKLVISLLSYSILTKIIPSMAIRVSGLSSPWLSIPLHLAAPGVSPSVTLSRTADRKGSILIISVSTLSVITVR